MNTLCCVFKSVFLGISLVYAVCTGVLASDVCDKVENNSINDDDIIYLSIDDNDIKSFGINDVSKCSLYYEDKEINGFGSKCNKIELGCHYRDTWTKAKQLKESQLKVICKKIDGTIKHQFIVPNGPICKKKKSDNNKFRYVISLASSDVTNNAVPGKVDFYLSNVPENEECKLNDRNLVVNKPRGLFAQINYGKNNS